MGILGHGTIYATWKQHILQRNIDKLRKCINDWLLVGTNPNEVSPTKGVLKKSAHPGHPRFSPKVPCGHILTLDMPSDPGSPPVYAIPNAVSPVKTYFEPRGKDFTDISDRFWTPLQRIHLLNDFLSTHSKEFMDLQTWQRFVNEFFTVDAVLTISLPSETDKERSFSISFPLIPRFFHTWSESGLTSLTFIVERIKETFLPNNLLLLDSNKMRLLSTLQNGQQLVEHSGTLRILFCSTSKIQFMELALTAFQQFVNSKSENLFTLPMQAGFDQAVHNFLEMLVLVQASFGNIGNMSTNGNMQNMANMGNMGMGSPSSLSGMANLTLENSGFQHQLDPSNGTMSPPQFHHMNMRPNHLPTLLPKPPTPVEVAKPVQPVLPKQPPPPPLKFEIYTPPGQLPPSHHETSS